MLDNSGVVKYLSKGVKAKGHTPAYKFHKYFARRPHNLFSKLIEHYSSKGEIIFDCFCGGGVTLVEGTRLERKVIGCDANPLAVFVSESQLLNLDKKFLHTNYERSGR